MYNGNSPVPRMDLSVAFTQFQDKNGDFFIGEKVFPVTKVPYATAKVSLQKRENYLTTQNDYHADGAEFKQISSDYSSVVYDCQDHALEQLLTKKQLEINKDYFDAQVALVTQLYTSLKSNQEERIADKLFSTSTFTGSDLYTDVTTAWTDTSTSNPLEDLQAAISKVQGNCGIVPDTLVVSRKTFGLLLSNKNLRGLYGVTISQADFQSNLAAALGLQSILVGKARKNSAKHGKAYVGASTWSDSYASVIVTADPSISMGLPGVGRTFSWSEIPDNYASIISYPDQSRDGDVYRCRMYTDEMLIDPYFGHLLKID